MLLFSIGCINIHDLLNELHNHLHSVAGKKRKDQHDANAGMGLNPAYPGAYGATPAVSFFAVLVYILVHGHVRDIPICYSSNFITLFIYSNLSQTGNFSFQFENISLIF